MSNMKLKRIAMAALAVSMVMPAAPMANQLNDRALFTADARGGTGVAPVVRAGTALIDDALLRVVPAPYRIMLDESVPASMYLVWGNGDNWMNVLSRALAPVGLVAEPDWSNNVIKIAWKKTPAPEARIVATATATSTAATAAAPAAPAAPAPVAVDHRNSKPAQPQPQRTNGSFVVVKSEPKPEPKVAAPAALPIPDVLARFTAKGNGDLPAPNVMWQLMQAAVSGDKIVLTGVSSVSDEVTRARFAGVYAKRLRAAMLAVGFPAHAVVIGERLTDRANKPGVRIVIIKGEV